MMQIVDREGLYNALDILVDSLEPFFSKKPHAAMVGIARGGVVVAQHVRRILCGRLGRDIPLGTLDITLYRDDLYSGLELPVLGQSNIPFHLEDKQLVLVDDVLFTGRTVRAALQEIYDYGRPRSVQLAVLVDRGQRELPIQADWVPLKMTVKKTDKVQVLLNSNTSVAQKVVREENNETKINHIKEEGIFISSR